MEMSATGVLSTPGFLARERTIAGPGFSRWLIPPSALAIHLCIGMAYGFSVFWLPLSKAIGITTSIKCPEDMGLLARAVSSTCDWRISELQWTFILFFVFLGSAAFIYGGWLERAGPRKAGVVATLCWCGGLAISAFGISIHQLWLLWLGSGVIGGIGLGLGYISPVSTLIKWFPDRRGMATGMAIMGFGGGAMIGAPLADRLMKYYATPTSVGVWETFLTLAAGYFVFMLAGALGYRVPADGWKPRGWEPTAVAKKALVTDKNVALEVAWRTKQFWLLWAVLCLNVTAGIGILSMASPLLQEVFGGRLIGVSATFDQLTPEQKGQIAAIAAGFTGLLSLFNIAGRIFWASLSDRIGRKATYAVFFLLGLALYASIPVDGGDREPGAVRRLLLRHSVDVWRWLRHRARLSCRPVRHPHGWRHPRPPVDGLVGRGRAGAGARELHPRLPTRPRYRASAGLQRDHVHPGRTAGGRVRLQLAGQAGGPQALHDCRAAGRHRAQTGRSGWIAPAATQTAAAGASRRVGGACVAGRLDPAGLGNLGDAAEGRFVV